MRRIRVWITVLAAVAMGVAPVGVRAQDAAPSQGAQHIEAGPIRVEFTLDRTSMNAAESVVATVRVTSAPGVSVELPSPGEKLGGFSVSATADESPVSVSEDGKTGTRLTRRFTLDPFLPGDYTIPALEIRWHRTGSGESGVARTAPVTVHVVSLLPEAAQKQDADAKALDPGGIRDAYTPARHRDWTPLILGAAAGISAALLTGWGARVLFRRRGGKDAVEVLLAQVHSLRAVADQSAEGLCHQLADAVHAGLGARLGAGARSLSAGEVGTRLPRDAGFSAENAQATQQLLETLDAIRFGGLGVSAQEREQLIGRAVDVLRALRDLPGSEA